MKKSFYGVAPSRLGPVWDLVEHVKIAMDSGNSSTYDESKESLLTLVRQCAVRSVAIPDESWSAILGDLEERSLILRKTAALLLWTPEELAQLVEGMGEDDRNADSTILTEFMSKALEEGLSVITLAE